VAEQPSPESVIDPLAPESEPHPFARFIAVLGRGKSLTRALTFAEAEEAMAMILAGRARPEQIGAFLMLLRVKEETGEEIAGFVRAVRATLPRPAIRADLDWPSYAGKRRRLPWFLLAALTLADAGWRVAMHGLEGHTAGRLYAREAIARLGLPIADGFEEAAAKLETRNFVYLPLDAFCPRLAELFALRAILGLRSPVHTLARLVNPFDAPASIQSVFHPGYIAIHRDAALRLGECTDDVTPQAGPSDAPAKSVQSAVPPKPAPVPAACSADFVARYLAGLANQPPARRPAPGSVLALIEGGQPCVAQMPAAGVGTAVSPPRGTGR